MALAAEAAAQHQTEDAAFLRVPVPEEGEDRIPRLRARVRHTTIIVLPADERILDFVAGDSEYWHLTGAANIAYLKPLSADAVTNIALVCESGRIYSFLVSEHAKEPPHLVVRVEAGAETAGLTGGGAGGPAFVARSEVEAYRQMAAEAAEATRRAREEAEAGIVEARAQAEAEIEAFRTEYPDRLALGRLVWPSPIFRRNRNRLRCNPLDANYVSSQVRKVLKDRGCTGAGVFAIQRHLQSQRHEHFVSALIGDS